MDAETTEWVHKLVGWLQGQGKEQKDRTGIQGWMIGVGLAALALFGFAALYIKQYLAGMERAKLEHERDVQIEEAKRTKIAAQIIANEANAAELHKKADEARARVDAIDVKLKDADTKVARTINAIDDLKNWRDVDRYINGSNSPPDKTDRGT